MGFFITSLEANS